MYKKVKKAFFILQGFPFKVSVNENFSTLPDFFFLIFGMSGS